MKKIFKHAIIGIYYICSTYFLAFTIKEAVGGQSFPGFHFFFDALPIPFSTARPRLAPAVAGRQTIPSRSRDGNGSLVHQLAGRGNGTG